MHVARFAGLTGVKTGHSRRWPTFRGRRKTRNSWRRDLLSSTDRLRQPGFMSSSLTVTNQIRANSCSLSSLILFLIKLIQLDTIIILFPFCDAWLRHALLYWADPSDNYFNRLTALVLFAKMQTAAMLHIVVDLEQLSENIMTTNGVCG